MNLQTCAVVKSLLLGGFLMLGVVWAAEPNKASPAEGAPVLKVNVTELPQSRKLILHPEVSAGRRVYDPNEFAMNRSVDVGVNVDVLWANRSSQPLRDITVRLDYVGSKNFTPRSMEQTVASVPVGGQWTQFKLRGGE